MSKVIAIMSMSLDGYVADQQDGVDQVFDWYFSGEEEIQAGGADAMTFHLSPPSAQHYKSLVHELGAVLTGRRTFEVAQGWGGESWVGTRLCPDPRDSGWLAKAELDGTFRYGWP